MEFLNDILQYSYLSNALIACVLSGITCGIIGTYIVARRMVFLCGGITHASFGGLGIAFYLNANPIFGATVFAVLSALGIEWSNSRSKIRPDSAIGMVWGTEEEAYEALTKVYDVTPERARLAVDTATVGLREERSLKKNEISL